MQKSNLERVVEWHKRCGKNPAPIGSDAYWEALAQQAERVMEELREVMVEIRDRNLSKLVSEVCDLDFTSLGMAMMVQHPHQECMDRIFASNDSKYTRYQLVAEDAARMHSEKGVDCRIVECDGYFSVHRNSDDKILKLRDFVGADVSDLIPEYAKPHHIFLVYKDNCPLCVASKEWLDTCSVKYELLEPEKSFADRDFCAELDLTVFGSIVFIDDEGVESVLSPKEMKPLLPSEVFAFLSEKAGI